jgi:uncharacterized membrane protein
MRYCSWGILQSLTWSPTSLSLAWIVSTTVSLDSPDKIVDTTKLKIRINNVIIQIINEINFVFIFYQFTDLWLSGSLFIIFYFYSMRSIDLLNLMSISLVHIPSYVCLFVLGFTSHRHSIGHIALPALLVEEDLRCPSVHYFRHERAWVTSQTRSLQQTAQPTDHQLTLVYFVCQG